MSQGDEGLGLLYRLSTFSTWPGNSPVSPRQLANCGFIYSGNSDAVVCSLCNTRLGGWKADDDPQERHRRNAPDCPLVNQGAAGNAPLTTSNPERISLVNLGRGPTGEYRSGIAREREESLYFNDSSLQYNRSFPDFDKLRYEEERLLTFYDWPSSAHVSPEALACAGLFYTGTGDRVRCAFCRGFIENWTPTDLPEIEHKKHYPGCKFIRGLDVGYVPTIKYQTSGGGRIRHGNDGHLSSGASLLATQSAEIQTTGQFSARIHHVEPREVKARMDTSTVRTILSMGFSKDLVKSVIEKKLQTTGDDFPQAESLLEALFQLEEQGKQLGSTVAEFDQNSASGANSSSATGSSESQRSNFASLPCIKASSPGVSVPRFQSMILTPPSEPAASATIQTPEIPRAGQIDDEPIEGNLALQGVRDEEATRYLQENRRLHEARTCKVCLNAEVDTVFLPCGHLVCCNNCSRALSSCPICRTLVRGTVKTFLS